MEPGDKVPLFTQAIFQETTSGALAMAAYYLQARNWALATNDATPFLIVCDAAKCKHDAPFFAAQASAHQRQVAGRATFGPPSVLPARSGSGSQWVVQTKISIAAGKLVDSKGRTVSAAPRLEQPTNLYLRWNGVMWRVAGDFLVG
jgi:hypothetical protein